MPLIENITEWLLTASKTYTLEIGSSNLRWAFGEINRPEPSLQQFRSCRAPGMQISSLQDQYKFDGARMAEMLKALVEVKYGIEKYATVILPDQAFHFGSITVPAAAGKASLMPLLERDVQKTAFLPCNSYIIKHEASKNKDGRLTVQYCALPARIFEDISRVCNLAGIIPLSIQPSFTGLFRLLNRHQAASEHPSVFLHIGNESVTMGIYEKAGLRTVNLIDFGVRNLLEAIMTAMGSDEDTAWQTLFSEPLLLEDPGASAAQKEILAFGVVEALLADFLQKVYGLLLLFSSEHQDESGYSRIVISGGGALIKNLDRLITFNLGIPTTTIGRELEPLKSGLNLPAREQLETLAPVLGNLILQPARRDRFDRVMAA